MKKRIPVICAAALLAACGDDDGGGALDRSSPEGVVRGFAAAMAERDAERARGYLMSEDACEAAVEQMLAKAADGPREPPSEEQAMEQCKQYVEQLQASVSEMEDDIPEGTEIGSVEKSDKPLPTGGDQYRVLDPDGELITVIWTMKAGDSHYAAFPVARRAQPEGTAKPKPEARPEPEGAEATEKPEPPEKAEPTESTTLEEPSDE